VDGPLIDVSLKNGAAVTFGRSRAADFVIDHHSVSKIHFSLRAVDDGVELKDLGSKNGTWYASRLTRHTILQPGDEFWAGGCQIKLVDVGQVKVEVSAESVLGRLIGNSMPMRELFATIIKLAPSDLDLLIAGETGTGKEITARTIHELSDRADGPYVVLDCSTLATNLAEAAIFGFKRGAFTGADHDQEGLFEKAHGGTLFIDEIGELDPALQMKFLRAIDCRQMTRLGEAGTVREVDVRIVAATNRDLVSEVREGRFREDLFHRLGGPALRLPSLRERGLDIITLAEHFLGEHAQRRGTVPPTLADDAKILLTTYQWPGNVRELRSALRRAGVVCQSGVIRSEDINLARPDGWVNKLAHSIDDQEPRKYKDLHMMIDRIFLPTVLEEHKTLSAAANHLGLKRAWLRERLRELDMYGTDES
jgi:DNA-binding NtrC family response regulator